MPVPLLPLFLGLLGGRELVQRKRANTSRQGHNSANLQALDALSGGGQLGFNGMGPPTRVGTGETNLDDVQIATTQAMALSSPKSALAQALAFGEKNRIQENFNTSASLQQAGLDQQKQAFGLAQDRLALDRQEFRLGKFVAASELADANRALVDPAFAEQRAAKAGDETFTVQDQQTGAFEQVPRRGTDNFRARVKDLSGTTGLLSDINRLRTLNEQIGGARDPANPGVRELQSLHTSVLLQLKDLFELGALSGDDIALVLARFPDPTAANNVLASTPEAIDQAFSSVSRNVVDELTNKLNSVRNFRGIDDRLINRAQQSIFGASRKDQQAFQVQTQGLADQVASASQVGGDSSPLGDALSLLVPGGGAGEAGARFRTRLDQSGGDITEAAGLDSLARQGVDVVAQAPLAIAAAFSGLPLLSKLFK